MQATALTETLIRKAHSAREIAAYAFCNTLIMHVPIHAVRKCAYRAFGMTLGFLFPDMERKAVFLPGASLFSKYLYLATSVWLLGLRSVLYLAHHHGYLSPGTLAAANVLFTLLATGACGLIIFCSLHRLERLEI